MSRFRRTAEILEATADAMQTNPHLDPDSALRQAVWGNPQAHVPEGRTNDTDLYDDAHSLIECYLAKRDGYDPGNGIHDLPSQDGITAARAQAARFRSYG